MSRRQISVSLQGRFGNQLFQYVFARAYAKRFGAELLCGPWIGEKIFQISNCRPPPSDLGFPRRNEKTLQDSETEIELRGYFQDQNSVSFYTRENVRDWLAFRPEIKAKLDRIQFTDDRCVAHRRVGDYAGYGYPVVSLKSYHDFLTRFGAWSCTFITEENPWRDKEFVGELEFLPDFYRMMRAEVLFRGNSSFSWWASALGNARTFSPIVSGLKGGQEHHCSFVEGNWPRFCNLDFCTDLHLSE